MGVHFIQQCINSNGGATAKFSIQVFVERELSHSNSW